MLTIKAWRRARGISQYDMAKKLGKHVNTYQNWEKEPEKIPIEFARAISEILGVSMNDILFEREEA